MLASATLVRLLKLVGRSVLSIMKYASQGYLDISIFYSLLLTLPWKSLVCLRRWWLLPKRLFRALLMLRRVTKRFFSLCFLPALRILPCRPYLGKCFYCGEFRSRVSSIYTFVKIRNTGIDYTLNIKMATLSCRICKSFLILTLIHAL